MDGSVRYPVKVPRVSTLDHVSQRLCGGRGATHHRNHKSYRLEPQGALPEKKVAGQVPSSESPAAAPSVRPL